jgi:hypothetical protein
VLVVLLLSFRGSKYDCWKIPSASDELEIMRTVSHQTTMSVCGELQELRANRFCVYLLDKWSTFLVDLKRILCQLYFIIS